MARSSLVFRGRARLFFTPDRWAAESKRHYARLDLPTKASVFLSPLLTRVRARVAAVAKATREGVLRVDDELHLTAMMKTPRSFDCAPNLTNDWAKCSCQK